MHEDIVEQYTDYISEDHQLLCWEFSPEDLEHQCGSYYSLPVKSALLRGLKTLSTSSDEQLREMRFTIWLGDYGPHYLLGVPSQLEPQATNMLGQLFATVAGYQTSEFGALSELGLQPAFRYERGRIVEYSDESIVGTEKIDDDEWYGSGLTILHRIASPIFGGKDKYRG